MSKDIIYREDAINLLWYFQDECCSAVVGDFEKLPSADRPQEWIPCSERLPEENDVYLVTAMLDYGDGRICRSEELAEYEPDPFLVAGGKWYIDGLPCGLDGTVTAWQPLPKPWKGTDDGE